MVTSGKNSGGIKSRHPQGARQRLLRWGGNILTDAELLSVLFSEHEAALPAGLMTGALETNGGLKSLFLAEPRHLCGRTGLGRRRGTVLLAAMELGRRSQNLKEFRPRLRTPRDIFRYLAPQFRGLRKEVFHVLCLNSRNVLIHDARIAEGSVNSCPVDPREVFAAAISARATAVVLAHNHPSGDPTPSQLDIQLTHQLAQGGRILGISVLDHLVLGDSGYTSMLESGELSLGKGLLGVG